jgi:hypothetical protein
MRAALLWLGDTARNAAYALLAAAALADVMVWAYDSGRAEALAELFAPLLPPTEEEE